MIFHKLQEFRKSVYENLGIAKDAIFEIMDAVMTSPSVSSYVNLLMNPLIISAKMVKYLRGAAR
jgi:hypothetical protein